MSGARADHGSGLAIVHGRTLVHYDDIERGIGCERTVSPAPPTRWLALEARRDVPTLMAIVRLLAAKVPFLPIDPRLSPSERKQLHEQLPLRPIGAHEILTQAIPSASGPSSTLALISTSGSGGRAKVVEISREASEASVSATWEHLGHRPEDRWMLSLSPAYVGGLSIVTRCLSRRVPIVLPPFDQFEAESWCNTVVSARVTLLSLVPSMLAAMLEHGSAWIEESRLRAVLLGGAAAPQALVDEARARGLPVLRTYGSTETTSQVLCQPLGDPCTLGDDVGRPLAGVRVALRDGQLLVRGTMTHNRYLLPNSITSPWLPDGWLATGDLAQIDENGRVLIRGRIDDTIITGGANVDPREVEQALLGSRQVAEALVFGVPEPRWGAVVCAAVRLAPGVQLDREQLASLCTRNLAPHKRPRRLCVVDDLPLTGAGKPSRRLARERLTRALTRLSYRRAPASTEIQPCSNNRTRPINRN